MWIFYRFGEVTVTFMTSDVEILIERPNDEEVFVPKREDIMNCSSKENINAFTVSTTQKIEDYNFIPIPPF